ncbi:MAG: hypothetical protein PHT88_05570, partial [Candidatus Moranbacteria bacterium]|nr:hypothetical protein [Candidatus Moranbacteria bacterium]
MTASLLQSNGGAVSDGEYDVRFTLYSKDRTVTDAYPSDSDVASRVWTETQKVMVRNGVITATLGAVNLLPEQFTNTEDYFLGVRVGSDSEMVPRKKLNAAFAALNALQAQKAVLADTATSAQSLLGKIVGTKSGDIPLLGSGGKVLLKMLPVGTGAKQLVLGGDSRLHDQNTDTGTTSASFVVGSKSASTAGNFDIAVSNDATKPVIRFNGAEGKWQFSSDGSTFTDFGDGGSDLSSGVTGILSIINGGTGVSTFPSNGILYGNGTAPLSATAAGTSGQLLFADASGVPTFTSLSGDATVLASGALTIAADAVALGVDTVGNYVSSIVSGNGISGSSATEGGSPTISVNLLGSADGSSLLTESHSGLEFQGASNNELTLLQGCFNDEVLAWTAVSSTWRCTSVSGVSAISGSSTPGYVTYWLGGTSISGEAQLSPVRGGTGINTASSTGVPVISSGTWSVATTLGVAQGGTGAATLTSN